MVTTSTATAGVASDPTEHSQVQQIPSFQQQIENVRLAMLQQVGSGLRSQTPPYDPDAVETFCKSNGAPTIFQELVQMMSHTRNDHAAKKQEKKETQCHAVVVLYQMCYTQSQQCNWMQRDVACFLHSHGLSDIGIMAMHAMGLSISKEHFHKFIREAKVSHLETVNLLIKEATRNGKRLTLMVDDYTNVHSIRRPTCQKTVDVAHMATILVRVYDRPAIPAYGEQIGPANDPAGVDVDALVHEFEEHMESILQPFVETAPAQIQAAFFTPEKERQRLTTHMYGENNNIRQTRGAQNSHLIDCVQQPLKSVRNFHAVSHIYLGTALSDYLQKYAVLTPGDWPAQFYNRQLAYNEIYKPAMLRNIVPSMGPLHISLNSQEHVVRKHINFFKKFYQCVFGKQLANKPRPWRVTLLLELLYGGWTLIRGPVMARLRQFKDLQFRTLLHLLDNNVPLSLSIYSTLFKSNLYNDYYQAIMQIWVMFFIYQRRHYDKSPLVWLSQRIYWRNIAHPMLDALKNHLEEEDEYPIEHFHGQIRGETNEYDTADTIRNKALWIDETKNNLHTFRSWFLPPPKAYFSHNQLIRLKVRSARFLVGLITDICTHPFSAHEQPRLPRQRKNVSRWVLPNIFGQDVVKNPLLPLGYQFVGHRDLSADLGQQQPLQPAQDRPCDDGQCLLAVGNDTAHTVVMFPCSHSFHIACLQKSHREEDCCFVCKKGIMYEVKGKAEKAREAIFHPDANPGHQDIDCDEDDNGIDNDGTEDNDLGANNTPDMLPAQALAEVATFAQAINNLPPVPLV